MLKDLITWLNNFYYTKSEMDSSLGSKAENIHNHIKSDITDFPTLSNVATSGDYSDLSNKPSIPVKISDLDNDSNFIETSSTTGLVKNDGSIDTTHYLSSLPTHNHDERYYTESEVDNALNSKQATLVSGTNIKTINNNSLLGSGNITIQGGGGGASNIFELDPTSQYGNSAVEQGVDKDSEGLGYGDDFLIFNSQETKFYYNKNGNADYDNGNELATLNDLPSVPTTTEIVNLIYPIGSIYMSINSTSPQILFGGTWQQLTDTFLYASTTADTNSTTATGGESTHSLSESEMPRHTHTQESHSHTQTNHTHTTSKFPSIGNVDWQYSSARKMSYTSGSYYYPFSDKNTGGIGESSGTGGANANIQGATATNHYTGGTGTSESASNGSAHNNMPPYMKVYMWKRTG